MSEGTKRPACPECGKEGHIYATIDAHWNPDRQAWELKPFYSGQSPAECTECDAGSLIGDAPLDLGALGFPSPDTAADNAHETALTAMCLWEAALAFPAEGPRAPWADDQEDEGVCALRGRVLSLAAQCDADWAFAQEHMGFDAPFDWEFAPGWLLHNYGKHLATPAERLAWLNEKTPRFTVDGLEFDDPESAYIGDGEFAPFRVFDVEAQDYVGETYSTRAAAQVEADRLNGEAN